MASIVCGQCPAKEEEEEKSNNKKKKRMAVTQRAIITPELLDTLRGDPNLPDDVWYLVVATALCILNRPEEIQTIYTYVVAPTNQENEDEQLRIARRLREALLKTSAIGGMPKVSSQYPFFIIVSFLFHFYFIFYVCIYLCMNAGMYVRISKRASERSGDDDLMRRGRGGPFF